MTRPEPPPEELLQLPEASIRLRKSLLRRVIEQDFEGNKAAFGRSLELPDLPHRKTILRWVSDEDESLPKGQKQILALAQALDVDPFLLLDFDDATFTAICQHAAWNLTWGSIHKSLSFLNGLFSLSSQDWPPAEMGGLFDGEWYIEHVEHRPREQRNFFQPFYFQPELFYDGDGQAEGPRPQQLWYFAFRDVRYVDEQVIPHSVWKPYGVVYLLDGQLHLLNLLGMVLRAPLAPEPEAWVGIETFFGQGAAQFRVASLHPFALTLDAPEPLGPVLRFSFTE